MTILAQVVALNVLDSRGFDEEGRNVQEWINASFMEFELSEVDRHSLAEIKRMLHQNQYHDEETIFSHIEFLEHLANRIDNAMTEEGDLGRNNTLLSKSLRTVQTLQEALSNKLMAFNNKTDSYPESDESDKPKESKGKRNSDTYFPPSFGGPESGSTGY